MLIRTKQKEIENAWYCTITIFISDCYAIQLHQHPYLPHHAQHHEWPAEYLEHFTYQEAS
jgi:hypothetical protein